MLDPASLSGKHILITGASSGIGRETARLVSTLGARATMIARRENLLREALLDLKGTSNSYYCFDLRSINDIENLIKRITSENGPVDGFVHSAGVSSYRPLKMMKPAYIQEVMEVNFYSFVEITRCITGNKNFNEGLAIVGISSISSLQGNQSKTAYCASKAAMDAAIRCMAKELAPKKIRVNSVVPGLVRTEMYDAFLENGSGSRDAENVIARQYLGIIEPVDVANMVAYLLSDDARFITGSSVAIDGGRLSS